MEPMERRVLEDALNMLRTAARQNSRKGAALAAWIEAVDPGAKGAASLVTEKKQAYNRVGEQFDRGATDVIFVALDAEIIALLEREIRAKWYAALRSVALFLYDGEYHLARLLVASADHCDRIAEILNEQYGTNYEVVGVAAEDLARAELRTDTDHELTTKSPPLMVAWEEARENPPPPAELIGLDAPYRRALRALNLSLEHREKNVILMGPPGVGKSHLAAYICRALKVRYKQVTATAEWTTFETIGGYFPDEKDPKSLTFRPGLVTRSILNNEWLIIDEINRADIDKCFGELFSVLSGQPVTLPYRYVREGRALPITLGAQFDPSNETELGIDIDNNWRIIGTMNTFDKASLFRMSAAFMRRFAFIELELPSPADYERLIRKQAESEFEILLDRSPAAIDAVNHLVRAFASLEPTSLREAGLQIGPAILIDIIRYLSRATDELAVDRTGTLLDAYRTFVLPQLEGRHGFYEPLRERLPWLLNIEGLPTAFERDLADWLGHDE
jgi:MoxR-like ATPase